MTTLVYDHKNKQVAVDSRLSYDGVIVTDSADKSRTNEKGIWVFAGVLHYYDNQAT